MEMTANRTQSAPDLGRSEKILFWVGFVAHDVLDDPAINGIVLVVMAWIRVPPAN